MNILKIEDSELDSDSDSLFDEITNDLVPLLMIETAQEKGVIDSIGTPKSKKSGQSQRSNKATAF